MDTNTLTEQELQYWLLLAELDRQVVLAEAGEGDYAKVLEINDKLNKIATGA